MYLIIDRDGDGRWAWSLRADDHRVLSEAPRRYEGREECLAKAATAAGGCLEIPVIERVPPGPPSQRPRQGPHRIERGAGGYWKAYGTLLQKQRRV